MLARQILLEGTTNRKQMWDDGNTDAGDGCSTQCQVEPGWKCSPLATTMNQDRVAREDVKVREEQIPGVRVPMLTADESGTIPYPPWHFGGFEAQTSTCSAKECGDGIVAGLEVLTEY